MPEGLNEHVELEIDQVPAPQVECRDRRHDPACHRNDWKSGTGICSRVFSHMNRSHCTWEAMKALMYSVEDAGTICTASCVIRISMLLLSDVQSVGAATSIMSDHTLGTANCPREFDDRSACCSFACRACYSSWRHTLITVCCGKTLHALAYEWRGSHVRIQAERGVLACNSQ